MKYVILYFAMLALTSPCYATVQHGDIVRYEGATFSTPVFPLEQFGPVAEKQFRLQIEPNTYSSANCRGYVATGEVHSNKLYLAALDGWIWGSFDSHKRATLELLFPGRVQNGTVFADWFSGRMFTPGYRWGASFVKEEQEKQEAKAELIITVERGNVIKVDDKRKSSLPVWLTIKRSEGIESGHHIQKPFDKPEEMRKTNPNNGGAPNPH